MNVRAFLFYSIGADGYDSGSRLELITGTKGVYYQQIPSGRSKGRFPDIT